jgi:hypothetical protein
MNERFLAVVALVAMPSLWSSDPAMTEKAHDYLAGLDAPVALGAAVLSLAITLRDTAAIAEATQTLKETIRASIVRQGAENLRARFGGFDAGPLFSSPH